MCGHWDNTAHTKPIARPPTSRCRATRGVAADADAVHAQRRGRWIWIGRAARPHRRLQKPPRERAIASAIRRNQNHRTPLHSRRTSHTLTLPQAAETNSKQRAIRKPANRTKIAMIEKRRSSQMRRFCLALFKFARPLSPFWLYLLLGRDGFATNLVSAM